MNILDENIINSQRLQLKRIRARQIGYEIGRKGMKDSEIIPFLHQLNNPAFFTRDVFLNEHILLVCRGLRNFDRRQQHYQ